MTYERKLSDGQIRPQPQYDRPFPIERNSPRSRGHVRGSMPPPPIPVDPALDSWNTSNIALSPGIGLDHLLQPPAGLSERPSYPGAPGTMDPFQQDVQLPSMRQSDLVDSNPLLRFYTESGPWNSQRIAGESSQASMPPRYPAPYGRVNRPSVSSQPYRDARSDLGSSTTGRNPHDSGYDSKSIATKSARSTEHVDHSQGCPSLVGDVNEMQIYPEEQFQEIGTAHVPNPQDVAYTFEMPGDVPGEAPATLPMVCEYPECNNLELKNQSDQRKHMLRHTRPFQCQEANCNRKVGFSTKNDLERHKKSVHKIAPKNSTDRSFRCAAKNCPKKDKIWPRLDNFRQHCLRMHTTEDCEELVKVSELNTGFSLLSHDVDTFPKESELSKAEQDPSKPPDFTNLHTVEKLPVVDSKLSPHEPSNSLSQYTDRVPFQANGSLIEAPGANLTQSKISSTSPVNRGGGDQTSLPGGANGVHQFHNVKSSASSCNSPEKGAGQDQVMKSHPTATSSSDARPDPIVHGEPTTMRMKAEQVSQKFASDVVKRMSTGTLEEIQSILKQSVLSLYNADGSRKRTSEDASLVETSDRKRKRVACEYCPKTMIRHCDLKKHKKRHTRPYGCTFASCTKAFGSKNDWKRHENTQHYQMEAWRCHEESSTSKIKQCARVFHRREQFQAHLKDHHLIKDDEYIRGQTRLHRIGRNGQCGFWCGFCQKIVNLKNRGLEAWDERFNHIDDWHFKKGQRIDEWYPLDKDVPKGLLKIDNGVVNGAQSVPEESESTEESSDDSERRDSPQTTEGNSPVQTSSPPIVQNGVGLDPSNKATKKDKNRQWYCCTCGDGPHYSILDLKCTSCQNSRCGMCVEAIIDQRHPELG